MLLRLLIAAVIGGVIGFERRARRKPIGIAGMMFGRHRQCQLYDVGHVPVGE